MDPRILEIVFYLVDFLRENHGRKAPYEEVFSELRELGYSDEEIFRAYGWFKERVKVRPTYVFGDLPRLFVSQRILTPEERSAVSVDAQGFLLELVNLGIIDPPLLEKILNRVLVRGPWPYSADQLREIVFELAYPVAENFGDDSEDLATYTSKLLN